MTNFNITSDEHISLVENTANEVSKRATEGNPKKNKGKSGKSQPKQSKPKQAKQRKGKNVKSASKSLKSQLFRNLKHHLLLVALVVNVTSACTVRRQMISLSGCSVRVVSCGHITNVLVLMTVSSHGSVNFVTNSYVVTLACFLELLVLFPYYFSAIF